MDELSDQDGPAVGSGLETLRNLAYDAKLPPVGALALMGNSGFSTLPADVTDPSAKWNAFTAGVLRPATGGFGEAFSNGLSGLAEGQQKEAELKAKYLPLVAQALMQRQLQAATLAMQQWKLNQDFDAAGVSALTGLLSKKGPILPQDAMSALGAAVQRGTIPLRQAQLLLSSLPSEPAELRDAINRMVIGKLPQNEQYNAVTAKPKFLNTGPNETPVNENPNAPVVVGAPVGRSTGKELAPGERYKTAKDQANNEYIIDLATNQRYYPGAASAPATPGQGTGTPPGAAGAPPIRGAANAKFSERQGEDLSKYAGEMHDSLEAMRSLQQRLDTMRGYVKGFQPGATADARVNLAKWLKDTAASLGLSPEQADSIAGSVAKGDLSDAQAFQKLAVQGTLDILKAANPRFTQAEFATIAQNNPNIALDPKSLDKMINFITRQYQFKSAEQREFDTYRRSDQNLEGWYPYWNQRAQELGYIKPTLQTGTARGSSVKKTETAVNTDARGRKIKLTDQGWVYE